MSYRNPEIIRDRSGEIYGQAVANIGQSLAKGIATGVASREALRKEADAEKKRVQGIGYQIESKAYANRNKNYQGLKKTEPGVAEQFKQRTETLLRGSEGQMGAIEANTILATKSDLSIEEKQELRAIVTKFETFQNSMVGNSGKILSETEIYNNASPADFDSKYRWSGSNEYERSASQYAAAAFSNQEIPGGRSEKILDDPGPNGENVVTVRTFLNPNDPANKGKFDDEKMYPRNQNGEIVLEWKKDLNKWDEGLLEEIEPVPDSIELFKTAGITNDKGGFNEDQYLNISGDSNQIKGLGEYSQVNIRKDINVAGWSQNKTLQDEIKSKASGLVGMRDEELSAFLQVKMGLGSKFSMSDFRSMSTTEQEKLVARELNEEFIIQKTAGLQSREAKEGDPGAVIDPLNPTSDDGKTKNYKIYFEGKESIKATQEKDSLSADEIKAMNKKDQQAYFTKKLSEIVFPTNSDTGLVEIEGDRFSTLLTGLNATIIKVEEDATDEAKKFTKIKSNITGKQIEVTNSISSDELKKALSILSGISVEQSDKDFPITYDDGYDLNY
tara:strand:- start:3752 stop:5425 length:1674 start_codon:yes stop_codon:yes gene_type:complete